MTTMKKIKKLFCFALALCMLACCFVGCGKKDDAQKTETDMEYVQKKGTLIVGITEFEPMDYKDDKGEWIGFDADMAKAFAEKLGVKAQFVEIDWDNKVLELNNKSVDCIWNGMTLVDEVTSTMSCTNPYCNNQQKIVINAKDADKYKTAEDYKTLRFAVENGSAGNLAAEENGYNFTAVKDQATAIMEVASGTADAAIIDSLMACAMVGEGTSYPQLTYTLGLTDEKYGVGFRQESDLTAKFNEFLSEGMKDGSINTIATTYKIQAALIK